MKLRKELIQHMKSVSVACCVCVQTCGRRRSMNALASSQANNKPVCLCGRDSHYVLFPLWGWLKIPPFDAGYIVFWLIAHGFSTAVMLFIASDMQLSQTELHKNYDYGHLRLIKEHDGSSGGEWRIHPYIHMQILHKYIKSTNKQNMHILSNVGLGDHISHTTGLHNCWAG